MPDQDLIALTADIVSSHVANNKVSNSDVPTIVQRVYGALAGLGGPPAEEPAQEKVAVVSVRASIKPDYIVCMECGKRQKTLKRHLQNAHGMSPQQYRTDYGLPNTYPMVAPAYSARRSEMAKSIGLGQGGRKAKESGNGSAPAAAKTRRKGRTPAA